jgi:integrase
VFDRRIDAERHLTEVLHTLNTGSYIDPSRSKIKTGDFINEKWLPTLSHLKAGTHAKYLGILDRHIRPRFGGVPLDRVTHADVAAWVNSLRRPDQRPLAPGSICYIHRVLYLVFELAVRDGRLPKNPAAGVKLPRLPKTEKRFLTRDEVFRLADAAAIHPIPEVGAQYKVLVLLLAHTGLRWSEAAGLKVECLNLMKRRLIVARTLGEVKGQLVWSSPKNHPQRSVPIPASLVDLLAELTAGKSSDDLVFTTWRGRPLRNLNWRWDCFDKAAEDAGLPGLTPHTLVGDQVIPLGCDHVIPQVVGPW